MALMNFRESNQVKWVGIRPAHRGEQVFKQATAGNATVIIHTVTANKTLYLVEAGLYSEANESAKASLTVRDVGNTTVRRLCGINLILNIQRPQDHWNAWPPVEVPAGYDIVVTGNSATIGAIGGIFGWEE